MAIKAEFKLPDNYIDYRKYFQGGTSLRNFDMLTKYVSGNATYQSLGDDNGLSRERVRQCIRVAEMKIIDFHNRITNNK